MVGEALVPYYRQILPVLNIFKNKNCKSMDNHEIHGLVHERRNCSALAMELCFYCTNPSRYFLFEIHIYQLSNTVCTQQLSFYQSHS